MAQETKIYTKNGKLTVTGWLEMLLKGTLLSILPGQILFYFWSQLFPNSLTMTRIGLILCMVLGIAAGAWSTRRMWAKEDTKEHDKASASIKHK